MRIQKLFIKEFKNLKNFEVNFFVGKINNQEINKQVIVGRNGSGKSNLFEAIITIFRDLDLKTQTNFEYKIEYLCNENLIKIENIITAEAKINKNITTKPIYKKTIFIKWQNKKDDGSYAKEYELLKESDFNNLNSKAETRLLPSYVFAYYSGVITRLQEIFKDHERKYYKAQIDGDEFPLRPLFLAKPHHSQFALLAFYAASDNKAREFLKNEFGILGIDSVLFSLREPFWKLKNPSVQKKEKGDPRFWYAAGKVKSFLESLFEHSFAPMAVTDKMEVQLDQFKTKERRFCYIPDEQSLSLLADELTPKEFFARMESMLYTDLINEDGSDIKININIENLDSPISFFDLSEGERQLITVLGLMLFTKESEALFLLDEPDTHQNPAWCLDYLRNLKEYGAEPQNSQMIMTSHNPLTIAGLEKEEVVILEQSEDGNIISYHPDIAPIGMGVNAILTSEFFRMRSALDRKTLAQLDRRRVLAFKENRTSGENEEFNYLITQLGNLDFSNDARDPLYIEYLRAITKAQKENPGIANPFPSVLSWNKRKELAASITKKLLEKS